MQKLFNNPRYQIQSLLGKGSFGEVYNAFDKYTKKQVAIKIESNQKQSQLLFEACVYKLINNNAENEKYLQLLEFGFNDNINYIVFDKKDISLQDYLDKKQQLSSKIVNDIAKGLIQSIKIIHKCGIIHRDIKPHNVILSIEQSQQNNDYDIQEAFLIDFGLSRRYQDSVQQHIKYRDDKRGFVGTARYASINAHFGIELSRRDDLESICYVLIYIIKRKLPWQNVPIASGNDKYKYIREKKINTPFDELTQGIPDNITQLLRYCKSLQFDQEPDYQYLIDLFQSNNNQHK